MNGPAGFGTGFEGSFGGDAARISPRAVMECKICWTVYDPALGDETRQVEPGTAFRDLPDDWSCPTCSGDRAQFMVLHDPGAEGAAEAERIAAAARKLEADFTEIWNAKMRDVPLVNPTLRVEAVGFRPYEGRALGVLVSPWFMNLVLLPAEGEDWSHLTPGEKEVIAFPSGDYEFIHNTREMTGGYKACSLFSPMGDFRTQKQATDVADAVMVALFDAENRAETDRAADIRATREAELQAETEAGQDTGDARAAIDALAQDPSRRAVISAGLAAERPET
jgi:[NiFe] hydrogenase assembly HybE family chaperone